MDGIEAPSSPESIECEDQRADAWMIKTRIIGKAQDGRWNPETAEKAARKLKVGPLARKPDPSQFDPMAEVAWSLTMAVAWISWRTPDSVRRCSDKYRLECWNWHRRSHNLPVDGGRSVRKVDGWELERDDPMTIRTLRLMEILDKITDRASMLMTIERAEKEIWDALANGQFEATAIKTGSRNPIAIPDKEWAYLTLIDSDNPGDQLGFFDTTHQVDYRKVTLKRSHVMDYWRPQEGLANPGLTLDKGGRPEEYNWDEMKEVAREMVQTKGPPSRSNIYFPTKAQFAEAISNEFAKRYDQHPADSSVRRRLNEWLDEWTKSSDRN